MVDLPSITILSGTPGTGKTTVAAALGQRWSSEGGKPLHLLSDHFFSFPVTLVPPEKPEAREQNVTFSKAIAASAVCFAEGGYHVIIDGVIGPWMLPHYLEPLKAAGASIAYVVLRAPLDETIRRAAERENDNGFPEEGVRLMHSQFADLKVFEPHVLETEFETPEQTVTRVAALLEAGKFTISMSD